MTGSAVSLFNTGGVADSVTGSGGAVFLTNAQTSITGGGEGIIFAGSSGNQADLYNTDGNWDFALGSNATIGLEQRANRHQRRRRYHRVHRRGLTATTRFPRM